MSFLAGIIFNEDVTLLEELFKNFNFKLVESNVIVYDKDNCTDTDLVYDFPLCIVKLLKTVNSVTLSGEIFCQCDNTHFQNSLSFEKSHSDAQNYYLEKAKKHIYEQKIINGIYYTHKIEYNHVIKQDNTLNTHMKICENLQKRLEDIMNDYYFQFYKK